MTEEQSPGSAPSAETPPAEVPSLDLAQFLGDNPTRDPAAWYRLWRENTPVPPQTSRSGLTGRAVRVAKRLLRLVVSLGASEAMERQRVFNMIVIEAIAETRQLGQRIEDLDHHLKQVHKGHQGAIEAHAALLEQLDMRTSDGLREVMGHTDALYARVDQKLDRYRRDARHLSAKLGAVVAAQVAAGDAEAPDQQVVAGAASALEDQTYLALERRWRGSEDEIEGRVAAYLPYLERRGVGPVLDLGCGRGELLSVLSRNEIEARGVDGNLAMVELCQSRGLDVTHGDLFTALKGCEAESLGAVVSLHVIEHLPPDQLSVLVGLAWRALAPKGILILETPSPLSLVASACNFWTDPTHVRPVHPDWLEVVCREAGFEPVHRLDLHPFPASQRLPEIDTDALDADEQPLADGVNRLRDRLDEMLLGNRDYALIGVKSVL